MIDFPKIKLLISDCDGVLTDGLIIYDSNGVETKHFSAHDGLGIMLLKYSALEIAVITGRSSPNLAKRCQDLGIKYLYQNIKNKQKQLDELLAQLGLDYSNVAYIGDDWNDFLAMRNCQLKIAPRNARHAFQQTVDYVTEHAGGDGAVRDAIEYILQNQGVFSGVLERFIESLEKE